MGKRSAICLFTLLMLLMSASWAEEIVYVHDELRLGVRPKANSTDAPLVVVTTGARLEVLDRTGSFVKVRTDNGVEGWVNAAYLSEEKPARLLLEELEEEHTRLLERLVGTLAQAEAQQGEIESLQQQLAQLVDDKAFSQQRMESLLSELQQLRAEITHNEQQVIEEQLMSWLYLALAGFFIFLLGIYFGYKWHRQRISDRMGGLEI